MNKAETRNRLEMIKELAVMESQAINKAFKVGNTTGALLINNSLSSFADHLRSTKVNFIPQMDIEYRTFVIDILVGIDGQYKELALKTVVFPNQTIGEIISEENIFGQSSTH